jgi:tetratricopeptide (TPR) repeat protein
MQRPAAIFVSLIVLLALTRAAAQEAAPATEPEVPEAELVARARAQIAAAEAKVTTKQAYEPAAKALALLCQSDPFFFLDEPPLAPAWTPPEVLKLGPTWVQIDANGAHVEFGGGFHHFGYTLKLNPAGGDAANNSWTLQFDSEDSPSKPLITFTLPKDQQVERAKFIQSALTEFHRRARAARVREEDVRDRLVFLLKFDEVELARKSIRECAAANTNDWPDELLAYLIDSKINPAAATTLDAWAKTHGDFTAWLLAAYTYGLAGDADSLERATKSALALPVDDPDWISSNARFRGTTVCIQLLKAKRYATCAALCDALLAYQGGEYLLAEITAVRDLARRSTGADAPPALEEGTALEPFKGIDLARLTAAKPATRSASAPATTKASADERDRLLAYYDHQIAADPTAKRAHTVKITYLLSQKRTAEALEACRAAAKAFPDWWRPPVALAMLGDGESRKQAEPQLVKWVAAHPAFLHSWYVARYYRESGRDAEAVAALKTAVKSPLEDVDDDAGWVPSAFAFDAASFAYRQKEFELVLDIARVWASPRGTYNYFDDNIYAFRAAAELALGQFAAAIADADKAVEARKQHANWAAHLEALQQAAHAKDQKFIYDPGTACGEWELFPKP